LREIIPQQIYLAQLGELFIGEKIEAKHTAASWGSTITNLILR
jgi:hypothetical protein